MMNVGRDFVWTCRVAAAILTFYGLVFLLAPGWYAQQAGYPEVTPLGLIRWPGGILLGLAVGLWLTSKQPAGASPMLTTIATACTLAALSLGYTVVSGQYGKLWSSLVGAILFAIFAALFWRLRAKYR